MSVPVEEVLSLWRELERVREELPRAATERQLVDEQITAVHELYRRLTEGRASSLELLRTSRQTIDDGFAALARAQNRLRSG